MALVLLIVVAMGSVTLFTVGFVLPRKSRTVQAWIDRTFFKGERKSNKAPGHLMPKALQKSLKNSRKLLDKSAKAGRHARAKTPR